MSSFYGGINIKNYRKILIFLGILILILLSYFVVFPFLLVGPPAPLFYVYNNDLQSHEITVEVFDSYNESIFKETYELAPEEHIAQPKSSWLLLRWSMPWSKGKYTYWAEGVYEFKVSLDNEITDNCRILPHPWNSVVIDIDEVKDSNSPISMGIVTV
ncbi:MULTISPECIES: hypothetical protein [unclassified Methanosarcina]|uniref:hypothetical protein n=1 Tax=unclassified Methanosarcina TaxID=2644672 RepID=UPI000697F1D2|nr:MULTISPECIES: hypothetical protein [unclassified Methanosarcina]